MVTVTLGAVVETGLADLVGDDPVPVEALAGPTGIPAERLVRLLRALRTVGVFDVAPDGVVHTETSRLLRRDADPTLAPHVEIHFGRGYAAWTGLVQSLREGGSAFERQRGMPMFDWLAGHPEETRTFNAAMAVGSHVRRRVLLARDWTGSSHVVDVGGGTGTNLLAVLQAHPHLTGTLVDLPHVEPEARAAIEAAGLAQRCRFAAETGRPAAWSWGPWMDLHMLVMLDGQERSEEQWRRLLDGTGWSVEVVRPDLLEALTARG